MRRPFRSVASTRTSAPKWAEHLFGVIARCLRFDHDGFARRGKTGQERRRLQLRRRNRRLEHDRHGIARAFERQRQTAVRRDDGAGADSLQRIEHAPHRPAAQRSVAVESRRDRAAGNSAEREPATGAGIAEIEGTGRLGKAADADAVDRPGLLASPRDTGAKRLQRLRRVEDILAFEHAGDLGLADRKCAQNKGPDRDRLVARHADATGQRTVAAGGQGNRSGVGMHA